MSLRVPQHHPLTPFLLIDHHSHANVTVDLIGAKMPSLAMSARPEASSLTAAVAVFEVEVIVIYSKGGLSTSRW